MNHWLERISGVLVLAALAGCASTPFPVAPAYEVPGAAPAAPMAVVRTPPRIGLALGGGAARGFAHVGVIQVLE